MTVLFSLSVSFAAMRRTSMAIIAIVAVVAALERSSIFSSSHQLKEMSVCSNSLHDALDLTIHLEG